MRNKWCICSLSGIKGLVLFNILLDTTEIISKTEKKIEVLQQRLDTFNFSQMNEEQATFYRKINEKLEQLEEELLSHYEEQENLDKLIFS